MSQALQALELANQKRFALADVKREVRALPMRDGLLRCADLIGRTPSPAEHIRVGDLLRQVHHFGSGRIEVMLLRSFIQSKVADRRIKSLSLRQREFLADVIRKRADAIYRYDR